MGWFSGNNKSKYKKKEEYKWWEDPEYLAAEEERRSKYSGSNWGGGYGYYYKPRFDMSVGLERRVNQLIKTITGKNLKLVQGNGWGSDDKYFYYNADDLQSATDDEVLGRILHQLAKELYLDKQTIKQLNDKEPVYRHLLNTLEDNRSDAQLQERYRGVPYFAEEVWESRKFKDNPINRYLPLITNFDELKRAVRVRTQTTVDERAYNKDKDYKASYDGWVARENQRRQAQYNPAWEFCFNISALQNGETNWDFWDEKTLVNFEQAVPYIKQYLAATTFEEALKVYPDIKKYYPVPDKQQQEQMDREMTQTEGLTDAMMQELREQAELDAAYAKANGNSEADMEKRLGVLKQGKKGSLDKGELILEQNLAEYKERLVRLKPAINALHYLIRSIIKDNTIKRFFKPFKRGKLDAKSMYKYVATDNLRIFKKPKVISEKKYSMAILVDQSGSMGVTDNHGTTNSSYAVDGAIILAEVFEMLGLPYEIIGFDSTAYIFKKFNSNLKREYIPSLRSTNGGTDDANALQTIKERIFKFDPSNTYHKGIFVISDGEGADPNKMKDLVTQIEKNHNATVFGVGIGDMRKESLEQSYNHFLMIPDTKDLPSSLVQLMRGQFRRG